MLNITYKHLQDPVKLGWFSLAQWMQLGVCGLLAYGLSTVLPLPDMWSLSLAITICGAPVAAAMVAMQADFDVLAFTLAAARWTRRRRHYLPGTNPAATPAGYHLLMPDAIDAPDPLADATVTLRADTLWD
ncbi:hypothetical protein C8N24_0303 [Solirubrobacter pauli]|uniref:PrgI family protein n=1 Tax=Solirubrobacter pauli TaxID=166793 RepID=A0A660L653_9ACTN|nr:hypothetical protein [Solirubrobacter pauli]RKQ90498.1 hypothetical protein C8N24_0303 [Solirubrobacter pauli]